MNNKITIRKAELTDLAAIEALAVKVWNIHYPSVITQDQIDFMLEMMYSQKSLKIQIEEKKHEFYLAQEADRLLGFISIELENENKGSYFLQKFYIDTEIQNQGLGKFMFAYLTDLIRARNGKVIRLNVNRKNYKPINFYFKSGFKIELVKDVQIGNGYEMNDFQMVFYLS